MNRTRLLRRFALVAIVAAGSLHLSRPASAATRFDACDDYAAGYAEGYCVAKGQHALRWEYSCVGQNAIMVRIDCA
jgi:hypothetical protein